ncbi:hypothetical protein BXZ70DRAFT_57012 [Cristinia sonorae]|uniref:Uncharacterized protein n=1 Tax=Cristinia sonorae TaxID=1940300 RepID=A0A8K0XR99_9AGAR|nr:hypothetical protein BXZ70DRAFT_57012 [Cristinia sonorae]
MATASSALDRFHFQFYDRPGTHWSAERITTLVTELRQCASLCLDPIPDYQCLSYSPSSLDDKMIAIARLGSSTGPIVAFYSSVILDVPSLETPGTTIQVLHTGLSCIVPDARSFGLTIVLCAHTYLHMIETYHPSGFWYTGLSELPSALVTLAKYGHDPFPSPTNSSTPSPMHLHIARSIANTSQLRDKLLISPDSVFDETSFVFKGSNPPDSCFRKDSDEEKWHHRDKASSIFYRKLLGVNEGNEVLVVGYILPSTILEPLKKESRLRGVSERLKNKL